MLFSSPIFLFLFLPLFFLIYFCSARSRNRGTILLASFLFYFWGEPTFSLIVAASIGTDWLITHLIMRANERPYIKKIVLAFGIFLNIGLLIFFKYTNFLIANYNLLLHQFGISGVHFSNVALPIGVSFVVFEKITYLVDVYRGTTAPAKDILSYATYILLFPKLLAGPIVKYHEIESQLSESHADLNDIVLGISRFIYGLAKKVLIADALGLTADQVFAADPGSLSPYTAWMGAVFFCLQIYLDFSAYSDMAIGLGRVLGFTLRENFNHPYHSMNFTDFWRRWHISLSAWIKEYLYMPLGGNRCTKTRTYFNLWFCFLISGIWHGANWTYVIWGIYHGFFLVCDKLFWLRISSKIPKHMNVCITMFFVILGWVIFRSPNLHSAIAFLSSMFSFASMTPWHPDTVHFPLSSYCFLILALLITVSPRSVPFPLYTTNFIRKLSVPAIPSLLQFGCSIFLLILSLVKVSSASFKPFLYFRF